MKTYITKRESDIIISNYYSYYKTFALSDIVDFHKGNVNWIMPKKGKNGPSIAFCVKLDKETAQKEIQNLVSGIRENTVPKQWIITPDAEPKNIVEILESNGFKNMSVDTYEPGMLLYKDDFQPYFTTDNSVTYRKIILKEDFKIWVDIVNTALHGCDMLEAEQYFSWIKNETYRIYIGEIDGIPVSTAAAIQNGDAASLEFVSTLKEYRHRHAASTVCSKALTDLFANGVNTVTLSASGQAVSLYKKLGFHCCFNNIIMRYDLAE